MWYLECYTASQASSASPATISQPDLESRSHRDLMAYQLPPVLHRYEPMTIISLVTVTITVSVSVSVA